MAARKTDTQQLVLRRTKKVVANVDTALVVKRLLAQIQAYADDLGTDELLDPASFDEIYLDLSGAIQVVEVHA